MMENLKYPLPWKVACFPPRNGQPGWWSVTNDAGDPRDEYDVLEDLDEATARFVVLAANGHDELAACLRRLVAAAKSTPAVTARLAAALAEADRLLKRLGASPPPGDLEGSPRSR